MQKNYYTEARTIYHNTPEKAMVRIAPDPDDERKLKGIRNALYQVQRRDRNQRIFRTKIVNNNLDVWRLA